MGACTSGGKEEEAATFKAEEGSPQGTVVADLGSINGSEPASVVISVAAEQSAATSSKGVPGSPRGVVGTSPPGRLQIADALDHGSPREEGTVQHNAIPARRPRRL